MNFTSQESDNTNHIAEAKIETVENTNKTTDIVPHNVSPNRCLIII